MKKGFTLIELLIVIAIIAILAAIAVPNFLEAQVRAKVARVKADQRSLATGLEAYYVDNNSYPAWVSLTGANNPPGNQWTPATAGWGHINSFSGNGTGAARIHSFRIRTARPGDNANQRANLFFMLTTPTAYISSLFPDPFCNTNGAVYGYYATKNGWILISFGPDTDEGEQYPGDIDPCLHSTQLTNPRAGNNTPESLYNPSTAQPSLLLLVGNGSEENPGFQSFTYDPTNGTTSEGDVYRTKQ